jgi:hypothetical protein
LCCYAAVKVFLRATLDMADVHQQVFERLKAPLLTLAAAGSAEPAYAVGLYKFHSVYPQLETASFQPLSL